MVYFLLTLPSLTGGEDPRQFLGRNNFVLGFAEPRAVIVRCIDFVMQALAAALS